MGEKKRICVGILAHVDAGKTTLSESLLYESGMIARPGRVDNQDAFLDTEELERERGITIFSKQAILQYEDAVITLVDTPGHVDFSAEMERALWVMDYAILVISGSDGVQGHTRTLWRLLERYQIPVFLFINKMDQPAADKNRLMKELKVQLNDRIVDFTDAGDDVWREEIAVCDETVMERYLEGEEVGEDDVCSLLKSRKVFPCFFGSALKQWGIKELLDAVCRYVNKPQTADQFGARVYKIARDAQGNRLSYLKITSGMLRVKDPLGLNNEKVNQIRLYSGEKYEAVQQVSAGMICAVTGLTTTHPGQGLGIDQDAELPLLEPVLTYEVELPDDMDAARMLPLMKELEEEEPELHVLWREDTASIQVKLMGEVQIEILRKMIAERYQVDVHFGTGQIVYKETIANTVEGVGHFEPLRHYAEVHLLMEPGEPGSGMQFLADCSEDVLDKNWQRLILTHLEERACWCVDRFCHYRYADNSSVWKGTYQTYRRWRFPAGYLSCGTTGTDAGRECVVRALLCIPLRGSCGYDRPSHDGCREYARYIFTAGIRNGDGCIKWKSAGCYYAELSGDDEFVYKGTGKSQLCLRWIWTLS